MGGDRRTSRLGHTIVVAIACACAGARVDAAARDRTPADLAVVELQLNVAPGLVPDVVEATMLDEASAIWRRAGIELRWLPSATSPSNALPVNIVADDPSGDDHIDMWRLAKLRREGGRPRVAVVSIDAGERALERLERKLGEPARRREWRLGLILGRALAHELGHFLLNTGTHSRTGLMRASIAATELAGLSSLGFFLDDHERDWVRTHLAEVTELVGPVTAAP